MKSAAEQFGLTLEQGLIFAIERGWASLTVQYLQNALHPPNHHNGDNHSKKTSNIKTIPQHIQGGAYLAADLLKTLDDPSHIPTPIETINDEDLPCNF